MCHNRHHPLLILAICFALSFLFAIVWVIIMVRSLPPSDGMYGQSPFGDPLVFPIMSIFASIAAIVVYPFTYLAFRDRQLPKAFSILATIVLAEIIFVTPFYARLGFLVSFVAYGIGLVTARHISKENRNK